MKNKLKAASTSKGAKIICVFNQKGGCGKTMCSMQLGGTLALRGLKVLIADMDRQATGQIWAGQGDKEFPAKVESMAALREKMVGAIERQVHDYDVIIIDCPPALESSIPWASLQIADLAIIPVIPNLDNIWASKEAKDLALRAKAEGNPALDIVYLPSNVKASKVTKAGLALLQQPGETVGILESQLSSRSAFPECQFFGGTVHEISKRSPATKEIELLGDEVMGRLNLSIAEAA